MAEDHQILGTGGGPLGQCSKKLISNPAMAGQPQLTATKPISRSHFYC